MDKIASPQDLQNELRRLLAYVETEKPSRSKLAAEIKELANRLGAVSPIEKIRHYMSQNQFASALKEAALLVGDQNMVKMADALRVLYSLTIGKPSRHLNSYLGDLADGVVKKSKSKLSPEDHEALKQAFGMMPL